MFFYFYHSIYLLAHIMQYNHAKVASLVAQLVKNPPAMQKTLACFPSWEDSLKKG